MAIRIVPHAVEKKSQVEEFNRTMSEAGSPWGFYVESEPRWCPRTDEDQLVWRELHLAMEVPKGDPDAEGRVVGGYGLKPQRWLVRGKEETVTDWQGPVSLGAVDNKYAALGLRLIRDMMKKQPLLYSWGHGGNDEPMITMLRKMGWMMHETPFLFRVCNPKSFLTKNKYLRQDPRKAFAQDVLAFSGLGSIGLHALHKALRIKSLRSFSAKAVEVPEFGEWADALWERASHRYEALAVRSAAAMNLLVPQEHRTHEWPAPTRLRVFDESDTTLGWAVVVDRQLEGDPRFGDMRVGMIADTFGRPEDSGEVLHAAFSHLASLGVDMVIANHSHPAWIRGFVENGFVEVEGRRIFCASPKLEALLTPFTQISQGLFLTNMDGHGPML